MLTKFLNKFKKKPDDVAELIATYTMDVGVSQRSIFDAPTKKTIENTAIQIFFYRMKYSEYRLTKIFNPSQITGNKILEAESKAMTAPIETLWVDAGILPDGHKNVLLEMLKK